MVLLGVAAFLVAMLVVLPARWVGGMLPPAAQCMEWRGTIWRGHCARLTIQVPGQQPITLESASWRLHPLRLLRGVAARAQLDPQFPGGLPAGWRGRLEMQALDLDWQRNQLQRLQGELRFFDLRDERGREIGSYQASFPAAAAPPFKGQLTDLGGPLELRATVELSVERNWSLNGTVMTRGGDDGGFRRYLEALGAPDASGRYPLSATGTFK